MRGIFKYAYLLFLFNELKEVSSGAVLKDDPEMVPRLVPVEEAEDVSVLQVVKDTHLSIIRV